MTGMLQGHMGAIYITVWAEPAIGVAQTQQRLVYFHLRIWTRHESEVSGHYRCKRIICLLHFQPKALCS